MLSAPIKEHNSSVLFFPHKESLTSEGRKPDDNEHGAHIFSKRASNEDLYFVNE